MLDRDKLEETLVKMVHLITELEPGQVIIRDQDIPEAHMPSGLFATVKVRNDRPVGASQKEQKDSEPVHVDGLGMITDIIDITKRQVELECSIEFNRKGSNQYASSLQNACYRDIVSIFLKRNKLGWRRTGPVNDLTQVRNAEYEESAQISLYLYAEDIVSDKINRGYQVGFETLDEKDRILAQGDMNGHQ